MKPSPIHQADVAERLQRLEEKFAAMGQDLTSYLDGLLYADYLTYWEYVELDTLLSLQKPRTPFPDELIFVTYHQITELYFKLIIHEIRQIAFHEALTPVFFTARLKRINRYVSLLIDSYDVMVHGMEKDQFLKFRMALLPSSGFQSVQYRMIEIMSTDMVNLVLPDDQGTLSAKSPVDAVYEAIYWKKGATELATQQKTLTLRQFERKYSQQLIQLGEEYRNCNLWQRYQHLDEADKSNQDLIMQLRRFDHLLNIQWKLSHLRSAVQYLQNDPVVIEATGGTNWQQYLPPIRQQVRFFPGLWNEEELKEWGKMAKLTNS
ncbi:tryptophan 2,3-dioxygenase family protein [Telluribacter sp. SYSU D00476]|uniref:tryptophan 2,3-dioxygenase family protein n=1 Tax=Telluribacter sp. SYSU D00476 TaxID=2811430 RepID=UPI001FF3998E|nr:tryptophan 2,3-dioxygenase family protein [Telluribacter sp. SYSU D00476]